VSAEAWLEKWKKTERNAQEKTAMRGTERLPCGEPRRPDEDDRAVTLRWELVLFAVAIAGVVALIWK
jgi:hypothetical protein